MGLIKFTYSIFCFVWNLFALPIKPYVLQSGFLTMI